VYGSAFVFHNFPVTNEVWSAALGLGFVLGLRHALDPDHVVAVSTIVSESRSLRQSSLAGTAWGLGHTVALLAAGLMIIGLKLTISPRVALWLESGVALMLIFLGAKAVRTALRGVRIHRHPQHSYWHGHLSGNRHNHSGLRAQPFLVGLVHGLAGSAGLMILVLGTIPSAVVGLAYVAVFGLGSTGGMLLMSSLISLPFIWTAGRARRLTLGLQMLVGLGSIALGGFLSWQHGLQHLALSR